jgi:plasmid stabilization system protein ParE
VRALLLTVREGRGAGTADRIGAELQATLELLVLFPGLGRPRSDLTVRPLLFFPFYSWFIVYLPDVTPLTVVRLISALRDLSRQL